MDLLWFSLACYGLTYLVVYASIFNRIRPSKEWLGSGVSYFLSMIVNDKGIRYSKEKLE